MFFEGCSIIKVIRVMMMIVPCRRSNILLPFFLNFLVDLVIDDFGDVLGILHCTSHLLHLFCRCTGMHITNFGVPIYLLIVILKQRLQEALHKIHTLL